jgi:diadenosine tetraphosphate (Ap4A) HIT family hydrolase
MILYKENALRIEVHESEIPWLKIFTQYPYKELSELPMELQIRILELLNIIEKEMLYFYQPTKINIASFGNHLPHLHWHIMARFENDSYFPEPMWGQKQRKSELRLPSFEDFKKSLLKKLTTQI